MTLVPEVDSLDEMMKAEKRAKKSRPRHQNRSYKDISNKTHVLSSLPFSQCSHHRAVKVTKTEGSGDGQGYQEAEF